MSNGFTLYVRVEKEGDVEGSPGDERRVPHAMHAPVTPPHLSAEVPCRKIMI